MGQIERGGLDIPFTLHEIELFFVSKNYQTCTDNRSLFIYQYYMHFIIFILQHTDTEYQTTDYMIAFMHFFYIIYYYQTSRHFNIDFTFKLKIHFLHHAKKVLTENQYHHLLSSFHVSVNQAE